MKAAASTTISQPIAQVFTDFADLEKRSKFNPSITELKITSKEVAGTGVTWDEKRFEDGIQKSGQFLVSDYKPPRLLVLDIHSMGVTYKVRYNFQPEGANSTKIIASIGGQQKGLLAKLMRHFLSDNSKFVHDELQKELDNFKVIAEKTSA